MLATAATVIPQIGSTAVATPALAGGAAAGRLAGAAAAVAADGDDPRQDRQRDLGRGARADVEPGGHVDPREQVVGHAVAAQLGEHAVAALAAGHEADVGHARLEAPPQRVQLVAPVRRDDQREIAGPRLEVLAVHADHVPARAPRRAAGRRPAIGVSPTTRTRGAGRTGSRKTSIAPPDRHGFCTVTAPSAAVTSPPGSPSSLNGRIRRSTASPLSSACSE